MKKYFKSWTLNYGALLIIFGIAYESFNSIQTFIPDKYHGMVLSGLGVIVMLLRMKTTVSLKDR